MIPIKKLKELTAAELGRLFNRFGEDFSSIMINTVVPIVNDVKQNGENAVKKYTEKFDGVKLANVIATQEEIDEGHRKTSKDVLKAFMKAKANVEEFHRRQLKENTIYTREDGITLGINHQPIESAGIYVPGGKASYPSSVLMGVIPAQIAGAKNITVITPPDKSGKVPDIIYAICKECGVKNIIKSGGAQGIAFAAFGSDKHKKSDIIVGPGNIFVTAAKTYLFSMGVIQIDSMAGPSEVLIISDEKSNPKWVAWDLLSQAEHEERALAVLVTTSGELAQKVKEEIIKDIESGCGRHEIKKTSIKNGVIIVTDTLDEAIDFSNKYGPEHMEFMVDNPLEYIGRIKNVGSLFLGRYSPVAVGDYYSGTNHILPTGGAARFSSGTSVETFLRRTTFQLLDEKSLKKTMPYVKLMSEYEGFDDKHGGSVEIRFKK
ncbi:MAG TPA: histidinol dehydrogenase [Spirochaetota bacterium]|nr:histidinol dehydrogenase [Spirochaetota bacterium]HPS85545.1 histidinol dehydrogenase [Spirochaetota bacterium]